MLSDKKISGGLTLLKLVSEAFFSIQIGYSQSNHSSYSQKKRCVYSPARFLESTVPVNSNFTNVVVCQQHPRCHYKCQQYVSGICK